MIRSKLYFALLNLYSAQFTDDNLWMNFREQDLHRHVIVYDTSMLAFIMARTPSLGVIEHQKSYLFGGVGYGPDDPDSNGTDTNATLQTFEINYNADVAPRDKRKLKNLEDSNFQDLDAFVTSECGKYSEELESKNIITLPNTTIILRL